MPDGITSAKLKAGASGAAQVQVKGRGVNLDQPALPLTLPVTVQLVIDDGLTAECWQHTYSSFMKNDGVRFTARGP